MEVVLLCGSHPRHQYLARSLDSNGYLAGLVVENSGDHVPDPPESLEDERMVELYDQHFELRADAEQRFFGPAEIPDVPRIEIQRPELNTPTMWEFVEDLDAELALSYGIKILSDESLQRLPDNAWNVHGGLSPQYKGGITHFWPSYLLEPQMTGITLHELTMDLDGGPIVHQSAGPLEPGDGIHELACRVVRHFADEELPQVLDLFVADELGPFQTQERHGKLWYGSDWRPDHLIPIYEKFDNRIVDMYLEGEINGRNPDLHRQFK